MKVFYFVVWFIIFIFILFYFSFGINTHLIFPSENMYKTRAEFNLDDFMTKKYSKNCALKVDVLAVNQCRIIYFYVFFDIFIDL